MALEVHHFCEDTAVVLDVALVHGGLGPHFQDQCLCRRAAGLRAEAVDFPVADDDLRGTRKATTDNIWRLGWEKHGKTSNGKRTQHDHRSAMRISDQADHSLHAACGEF